MRYLSKISNGNQIFVHHRRKELEQLIDVCNSKALIYLHKALFCSDNSLHLVFAKMANEIPHIIGLGSANHEPCNADVWL